VEFLLEFNFYIIYIKGKENIRADILSQRSDHVQDILKESITLFYKTPKGHLVIAFTTYEIGA
jgi:hypothetical protein